jgi:hypothetical protein
MGPCPIFLIDSISKFGKEFSQSLDYIQENTSLALFKVSIFFKILYSKNLTGFLFSR